MVTTMYIGNMSCKPSYFPLKLRIFKLIQKTNSIVMTVNQHPQAHREGWMDDKWLGNNFLLSSSFVANHGD
jgi:hypothetical protein